MTTKIRIIIGFSVVIVLLGAMAFFGLTSLKTASTNFNDYRRLANVNVNSSDLKSAVYEAVYYTELYLKGHDRANMDEARRRVQFGLAEIEETRNISRLEGTLKAIAEAEKLLNSIDDHLNSIQGNIEKVNLLFTRDCLPNMNRTDELLKIMADGGRANARVDGLFYQTRIWMNIAVVRENLMVFLESMDMEAAGRMLGALDGTLKAIDNAGVTMNSPQGQLDYAAVRGAFQKVMDGVGPMVEAGQAAQDSIANMKAEARKALVLATELDEISNTLMAENGSKTLATNNTAQTQLMGISIGGVLLGVAFAVFTIIMLVRTLARMSVFASDIAEGNFNSQIRITEKGEIGSMFLAMRRIPEIFSNVIIRCNDIANDIASGQFRDRLDSGQFQGGFRDLADGINSIADSYTRSIDNLPVGIVTLNSGYKTIFTNAAGAQMVGEDAMQAFGGRMPVLESSMNENRVNKAESHLTAPDGRAVEVAATAIPMRNLKGETVGGLEVLTDISEIKEKQNIMLRVANEASNLTDRVAAAAEQLAAQVEEVSRGAEVQRTRVESTASAMTEMNSTVIEVARSASEASEQSKQTRENAEGGSVLVNKVVSAINRMNTLSLGLQNNMQTLGQQANSIGSVMNVISDIADQTNLLALNAAIEAARAGEAGRGFAVVADEVRKLAENTMNATKEVGDSIEAIQESARANIDQVEQAVQSINEATGLANESGEALNGIVGLADATSNVVSSIATAAEEQSATSEEITQSVDEINRLVAETTDGMVQSSSAVQELSRIAQELRSVMEGLR